MTATSGSNAYDAIVVGGGHNGLVTAAYLARAEAREAALRAHELQRRDPAVRTHDPAARVGRRAGQPEVADRRPEARPARHRPREEQLLERKLALEDVALRQAGRALDVEGR
ncbi:MAG TPA: hypothetical protein VFR93_07465, partial [Candidatus Limnocylindrales bacterium]|nr:hypothetical protein [Candidatus Limnocylindrales bacterium]